MSPRSAHFRSDHQHELRAAQVLREYQACSDWTARLPVPVHDIVERLFNLKVVYDRLHEEDGQMILGALTPASRLITLNEQHLDLFETCIGPENFTLAHELGHWLYDADDPDQGSLFDDNAGPVAFCRDPRAANLAEDDRIRERNANRFAARLLLPGDLVRTEIGLGDFDLPERAAAWGVSRQTLRIRLEELSLPRT